MKYLVSVTKRITISVPDDVAAQLEHVGERQVSAYVVRALRQAAEREERSQALEELFLRFGRPGPDEQAQAQVFADRVDAWRSVRPEGDGSLV